MSFRGRSSSRPLPSEWLPSAAACVGVFLLACSHALFYLMCRWSVDFRLRWLYAPATSVRPGCQVRWALPDGIAPRSPSPCPCRSDSSRRAPVRLAQVCFKPLPHKGKPMLVPLRRAKISGRLGCDFQRQHYEIMTADEPGQTDHPDDDDELVGPADALATVRLVAHPTRRPRAFYAETRGFATEAEVEAGEETFGPNILSAPTPRFVDLYIEQLLSPLAIFQIFCSLLWLLDAVSVGFTAFQLFTILLLESTTVFQRQRTLKTLSSMSAKPYGLQVYRKGAWVELSTTKLLPGDLISIKDSKPPPTAAVTTSTAAASAASAGASAGAATAAAPPPPAVGAQVVPCDCVVLRGAAVVNEASLTGESVPQMKEQLPTVDQADATKRLDVNGGDRVHALFAGTTVVSSSAGAADSTVPGVPPPPDGGCLCFVVRCGFSSSQGELMQMIEFSQQQVSDDSRETLYALLLLLIFALMASGYVFVKGLEKGDRTTHELLLKCVIIITSVVPRQLPMQTALAVNTALMALIKAGVFCTEPFRVPFAGKIDAVLFDKTGTLTTDKLVPVSVVNAAASLDAPAAKGGGVPPELAVGDAATEVAVVLAGCHSLIQVEGVAELMGDPIETAALGGVAWMYNHATQTATPGDTRGAERAVKALTEKLSPPASAAAGQGAPAALPAPPPLTAQQRAQTETELAEVETALKEAQRRAAACPVRSVKILHRHHFASALQRMSTVVELGSRDGTECRCLVKGSPEALLPLLETGNAPAWFGTAYRGMAERGMRVLALAHKVVPPDQATGAAKRPREWAESGLIFDGFIAFACKTRADSATVISALTESAHSVSMLTGDAPLTALHVAHETRICSADRPTLLLATPTVDEPVSASCGTRRTATCCAGPDVPTISVRCTPAGALGARQGRAGGPDCARVQRQRRGRAREAL